MCDAVKKNWSLLKGALTSFSVVCKAIAHSIQSRLFYLTAKFKGLETKRTWATSEFLKPFKKGNYFCELPVCDDGLRHQWIIYIQYIRE